MGKLFLSEGAPPLPALTSSHVAIHPACQQQSLQEQRLGDDTQTSLTIIQTGDDSSSMPSLGSKSPVTMGEWRQVQAKDIAGSI